MNKILEKARAIEQEIIADRRCLHQMPEVVSIRPGPRPTSRSA